MTGQTQLLAAMDLCYLAAFIIGTFELIRGTIMDNRNSKVYGRATVAACRADYNSADAQGIRERIDRQALHARQLRQEDQEVQARLREQMTAVQASSS